MDLSGPSRPVSLDKMFARKLFTSALFFATLSTGSQGLVCHRMFYLALPPSVFMPVTTNIKAALMDAPGKINMKIRKHYNTRGLKELVI